MRLQRYLNEAKEQLKQWKEYVNANKMLASAVKVLEKINKKGYDAWVIGGAVRDIVIGQEPHDIDIATSSPIDTISKIWKTYDIGKSRDFGIVTIKEGGYNFEISQLRNDGKYSDGRRPEKVSFNVDLKGDMKRRDLQVNAMAIDKDGNIIDHFQGQKDIQDKVLRTVGNPYTRFSEDFLRIMRVPRFAAKLGFDIEKQTGRAMKRMSKDITKLSPERIKDEIMKAASQSGDKFAKYIMLLDKYGILKHILPEVVNLKAYKEDLRHHPETIGKGGSPYAHTIEALKASDAMDPLINISILLHDIGKGVTFSDTEPGKTYTYYRHERKGVSLVQEIAKRLKMSNKERDTLLFTVANHMKMIPKVLTKMKSSKIFKMVNDDNWDALVAVSKADDKSRGYKFFSDKEFNDMIKYAENIKNKWGKKRLNKSIDIINGNRIMEITGLKPSKEVGIIKKKVINYCIDNNITDKEQVDSIVMMVYNELFK